MALRGRTNSAKKKDGKIYRSTIFSLDAKADYYKTHCEICGAQVIQKNIRHKRCESCTILARKINRSMNSGGNKHQDAKKAPSIYTIEVAKRFFFTVNCSYCNCLFTEDNYKSIDHVLPICKGGANVPSNISICCIDCNRAKAWLTFDKWIDLCKRVCVTQKMKLDS